MVLEILTVPQYSIWLCWSGLLICKRM